MDGRKTHLFMREAPSRLTKKRMTHTQKLQLVILWKRCDFEFSFKNRPIKFFWDEKVSGIWDTPSRWREHSLPKNISGFPWSLEAWLVGLLACGLVGLLACGLVGLESDATDHRTTGSSTAFQGWDTCPRSGPSEEAFKFLLCQYLWHTRAAIGHASSMDVY